MGCLCSCCEGLDEQCESSELCEILKRPWMVHNCLYTPIDSLPLHPPLWRPVEREIQISKKEPGMVSPGKTKSSSWSRELSLSPQRPPTSAAIPIRDTSQPGCSRGTLARPPYRHFPSGAIGYVNAQVLPVTVLRQLEVTPQGLSHMMPTMGIIGEESTDTELGSVVESRSSLSDNVHASLDNGFPSFSDTPSSEFVKED